MKSLNLFSVPLALCLTVALAQESQSQGIEVQDASPQATAPLEFSYVSASHDYSKAKLGQKSKKNEGIKVLPLGLAGI